MAGVRPMAMRTQSKPPKVRPSAVCSDSFPSAALLTAEGVQRGCSSGPCFSISPMSVSTMKGSKPRRSTVSPRKKRCASVPSPWKMPAISTPMYPEPITAARAGCSSRSKKPSEEMQCSAPGIAGIVGAPPQAMSTLSPLICRTLPSSIATRTVFLPVKDA